MSPDAASSAIIADMSDARDSPAQRWAEVDQYITERLAPNDAVLDAALRASAAGGLPAIQVSANLGKLLMLLAQMVGARRILEIGTLGGYSTIWLGRALETQCASPLAARERPVRLVTLEVNAAHAEVARASLARAGLADVVELRVGPALETLPRLESDGSGPFDLTFIDADKPGIPAYVEWAIRLSRPGSVIVVDNVVREGQVADAASTDPAVLGVREMFDRLAAERRVRATAIQTVGSKGYDGFAIALVT